MSPGVPQFDPEFQTHLFLHFSACRFHPNRFPVKTETFLRAAPRERLGKISSGQPFQPNLGMSPGVPQFENFKPIFSYIFQHADSTQSDSRSKRKPFCAPRRARACAKSVLASPAQGHSSQIWVCHRGYPSLTQNLKPIFSYIFQHADSTQVDSRSKRKLFCAPHRARAWAKSVLASPAQGHSSQIWVRHRGYPSLTQNFKPIFSYIFQHADSAAPRARPNRFPVKTETFLRAAPRARLGKISYGQPSPGPFQPNLGMSPGVPQFDAEFQIHLFLHFSACRFHPNRFPVKTETFLRAAPRTRLGKISSGQPSPGPFQPNLGMSPGVPQFDPEFETHLFLHFSACRFHPNRFPVKTETFLRAGPRARLGKISSGQPSPGPFQPNLGMSPGVPQFDPEFETHLFLYFSACRFHPNRFPVKTESFLRTAPRARQGKISSGQPSPGPFEPNLGMSLGVPQFDPEFETHLFLHFSACRIHPNRIPVKTEPFCAPRRACAWAKSVLASPAQGHSSQIWVCHRGYPSLTQNLKPIFSYIFQHADSTQIDSRSKRKPFCAPRRARAWAKSVLASHSSQIWVCHRGYPSLTQNFKPIFSYIFQHADSTQSDSRSKRKPFCAPRRARACAKSVLASPAQGHSSQIWVCHRGYPSLTQNFKPIFSYIFQHADSTQSRFPVKTETFLRAAPRARLGKISSGQPSPGPFQPNLGMSPGVPQFDPEFQTHLFLHFSACRFHPNRFPVKTETFLRAAPRARLGKISSGQPSPGPFQPNLGMSPGVPQFDPEFQTHLFLHFSACRFHPNRFPVKTETFLRAAPRARLGKISYGQPSPGVPAKSGYVTGGTPV